MSGYTHLHLPDATDIAPGHGIGDVLEGRFVSGDLGGAVVGLSYQRLRPGGRIPFGHRHARQEEVYVVLSGSGRANVDGTIVELVALDALRVAPEAWRALEAGPEGMDVIAIAKEYPTLSIMGGLDKRALAADRTAIKKEVDRVLPVFLDRGLFMPTLDHTVPPHVSLQNFQYYLECVRAYEA